MTIWVLERESSDCDGMVLGVFSTEDKAQRAARKQAGNEYPQLDWIWADGALQSDRVLVKFPVSPLVVDAFTPRVYAI